MIRTQISVTGYLECNLYLKRLLVLHNPEARQNTTLRQTPPYPPLMGRKLIQYAPHCYRKTSFIKK